MEFDLTGTDWMLWWYPRCVDLQGVMLPQHYPPWTYLLLWPLTIFGPWIGLALLTGLNLLVLTRYLRWRVLFLIAMPPTMIALLYGEFDPMLVAVLMLPTWAATIVASCKPIVFFGYIYRRIMRSGLMHSVPMIFIVIVSVLVLGLWPLHSSIDSLYSQFDLAGLWPCTIPVGIMLILLCNDPLVWLIGGAMLMPYIQLYHLTPMLAYYVKHKPVWKSLLLLASMWIYTLWRWN